MDIFEYNEEHLSTVAENCRYMNFKQPRKAGSYRSNISCSICSSWNGTGCTRKHFDNIASELHIE